MVRCFYFCQQYKGTISSLFPDTLETRREKRFGFTGGKGPCLDNIIIGYRMINHEKTLQSFISSNFLMLSKLPTSLNSVMKVSLKIKGIIVPLCTICLINNFLKLLLY